MKLYVIFYHEFSFIIHIISFIASCSFVISTLLTIDQFSFKRFLVYSSIAQVSLLITSLSPIGGECTFEWFIYDFSNAFFFLACYLMTSLIAWTIYAIQAEAKFLLLKNNEIHTSDTPPEESTFHFSSLGLFSRHENKVWILIFIIL